MAVIESWSSPMLNQNHACAGRWHSRGTCDHCTALLAVARRAFGACRLHAACYADNTMLLQIESKIFFCDAKTNTRGLYLKISEKKANRERSTIIVPGRSLPWFRELFHYYATTDPSCVFKAPHLFTPQSHFGSAGNTFASRNAITGVLC